MATPISAGMEMHNYINEKKKRITHLLHNHNRVFDKEAIALVERILGLQNNGIHDKTSNTTKEEMIVALYKILSEEYLSTNTFEK
jgi:metal-dependent HD superfamily phosphatase/phosphodiesterase